MENNLKTKTYLEQIYSKKLTESEALEYKSRLTEFVELLIEIDRKNRQRKVIPNEQS